jgi:hypothetical protein
VRILDFSDSFTSSTQPTAGSVPASGIAVTPTGNVTSTDVQSALVEIQTHVDTINAEKGATNGLASLDSGGHVPVSQMPAAALGALSYKGALDASGGSYPASPAKGDYYVVNVPGTISTVAYKIGDWATYDGTAWDKIDNGQSVVSVAGRNGVVVLTKSDVGLSNVDNTSDATKNAATATLSNKTLTAPIIDVISVTDQGSIPSTPASGTHKLYSKAAGMFILDSTGVEKPVGSGSGGGSKNYLSTYNGNTGNGDFELNNTNGWSLFHTTLTGTLPTGSITSGATSWTTFGIASGTSLAGSHSMTAGGSSGLTAGEGFISDAFTIDKEDQARVQTIAFSYSPVYGTLDFSGTSSNTFAVYVYDVTNSVWIQPAGCYGMTQASGVGEVTATFQTSINSTQYRLAIVCINACSGLTDLLFDSFSVGPQAKVLGAAMTDFQVYTPTFTNLGTVTSNTMQWSRSGDSVTLQGTFVIGTGTASPLSISLPPGLTIDSTKVTGTESLGSAFQSIGSQTNSLAVIGTAGATSFGISVSSNAGGSLTSMPGNTYSGATMSVSARIPIAGWSSNVQMSSDTDTRVVSLVVSGTAPSVNPTAGTPIILSSVSVTDTHASYNSGTGVYTCPVSGFYQVGLSLNVNGTNTGASVSIAVNGTPQGKIGYTVSGSAPFGFGMVKCNAGDQITITGNATWNSGGASSFLTINRLSGPSVIAASDSVAAIYGLNTDQSLSAGDPIKYDTKAKDTHGIFDASTGLVTIRVPGTYDFSGIFQSSALQGIYFVVNGVTITYVTNAITANHVFTGLVSWPCNAGDTVSFRIDTSGTMWGSAGASGYRNMLFVKRTGN